MNMKMTSLRWWKRRPRNRSTKTKWETRTWRRLRLLKEGNLKVSGKSTQCREVDLRNLRRALSSKMPPSKLRRPRLKRPLKFNNTGISWSRSMASKISSLFTKSWTKCGVSGSHPTWKRPSMQKFRTLWRGSRSFQTSRGKIWSELFKPAWFKKTVTYCRRWSFDWLHESS